MKKILFLVAILPFLAACEDNNDTFVAGGNGQKYQETYNFLTGTWKQYERRNPADRTIYHVFSSSYIMHSYYITEIEGQTPIESPLNGDARKYYIDDNYIYREKFNPNYAYQIEEDTLYINLSGEKRFDGYENKFIKIEK